MHVTCYSSFLCEMQVILIPTQTYDGKKTAAEKSGISMTAIKGLTMQVQSEHLILLVESPGTPDQS